MRETVTLYRAISPTELQELKRLNDTEISLEQDELDFQLDLGSEWDSNPDGWPAHLINSPQSPSTVVVALEDRIIMPFNKTEHTAPKLETDLNSGVPFEAVTTKAALVKVSIHAIAK